MGEVVNVSCLITVVSPVARCSTTFMANIVFEFNLFSLISCKRQYYLYRKHRFVQDLIFIVSPADAGSTVFIGDIANM